MSSKKLNFLLQGILRKVLQVPCIFIPSGSVNAHSPTALN